MQLLMEGVVGWWRRSMGAVTELGLWSGPRGNSLLPGSNDPSPCQAGAASTAKWGPQSHGCADMSLPSSLMKAVRFSSNLLQSAGRWRVTVLLSKGFPVYGLPESLDTRGRSIFPHVKWLLLFLVLKASLNFFCFFWHCPPFCISPSSQSVKGSLYIPWLVLLCSVKS